MKGSKLVGALGGLAAAAASSSAHALAWYFQSPGSQLARDIDHLHQYVRGEGEGISFVSMLATPREQIEGRQPKGENYLLEVDNELVVPIGKKIRVITTAADVIHSWWVPAFGAKQDAIPGFLRDLWFKPEITGTFRSQCVELCGNEHGFMPIVVRVDELED